MQAHSFHPLLFPPAPSHSLRRRPNPHPRNPHFPKTPILLLSAPKPTHLSFSSPLDGPKEPELELLNKPSPIPQPPEPQPDNNAQSPELEEALAPFLKFFKSRDSDEAPDPNNPIRTPTHEKNDFEESSERVEIEYYDPKPGDLAVGVVVSGNENKLDVNVGADFLGTMLTKEVMPFYEGELGYLLCALGEDKDREEFGVRGKMGVLKDEEALGGETGVPGRPVVEAGTVVFSEVLGRTLSGRPLLSSRRLFRRVAWHRVRQIKQLNEPFEVKIFEWNTGGLLTRIEGLRAFLPKAELMNRINNFMDLKDNVGRRLYVCIIRIDEATNDLIISEREAWDMLHLKEGTLLAGTVRKIFPYGAQVRIGETNRSGLLHISNISRARVPSVNDALEVNEKVKVLVVKSMFPDKISLSIADLESEPGLFLSDKEKVFAEAEEMAKRYRQKLRTVLTTHQPDPLLNNVLPFDDEARLYANWKWFKFEQPQGVNGDDGSAS